MSDMKYTWHKALLSNWKCCITAIVVMDDGEETTELFDIDDLEDIISEMREKQREYRGEQPISV